MYQEPEKTPIEEHEIQLSELIHIATELGFLLRDWGKQKLKPLQDWLNLPLETKKETLSGSKEDFRSLVNYLKANYSNPTHQHPSLLYLAAKYGYSASFCTFYTSHYDLLLSVREVLRENDLEAIKFVLSTASYTMGPSREGIWKEILNYAIELRKKDIPDSLEKLYATDALLFSMISSMNAEILEHSLESVIKSPRMAHILDAMLSKEGVDPNIRFWPSLAPPVFYAIDHPETLRVLLAHGTPFKKSTFINNHVWNKTPIEIARTRGNQQSIAILQEAYVKEFYQDLYDKVLDKELIQSREVLAIYNRCNPNGVARLLSPSDIFAHIHRLVDAEPDPSAKIAHLKTAYQACRKLPVVDNRVYFRLNMEAFDNEACRNIKDWIDTLETELGPEFFLSQFYQEAKRADACMLPVLMLQMGTGIKNPQKAVFNYFLSLVEKAETTALKRTLLQEGLIFLEKKQPSALAAFFDNFNPKIKASWIMHLNDWLTCLDEKTYTTSKGLYFTNDPVKNGTVGLPQIIDEKQKITLNIHRI